MKIVLTELVTFALCLWSCNARKLKRSPLPDCDSVLIEGPFGDHYEAIGVCYSLRDDLSWRLDYDETNNLVFHKGFNNADCSDDGVTPTDNINFGEGDGLKVTHINLPGNKCRSVAYNMHKISKNLTSNTVIIQKDYAIESRLLGPFCSEFLDIYYQYNSCNDDQVTWTWYYDAECTNKIKPDAMVKLFYDKEGEILSINDLTLNGQYVKTFGEDQYHQYITGNVPNGDVFKFEYIAADIVCFKPRTERGKKLMDLERKTREEGF